jgi:hypothetical protein
MLPTSTPAPATAAAPTSTSTLTARNRSSSNGANNNTATASSSPNSLKKHATATAIKRSASVSRSLGAPDSARHVALLSRLSRGFGLDFDFDPYSIFLTPHYTDEQLRRHRGWMRLLPENWKVPLYVLVWYWPPLFLELAVSGTLAIYETFGPPAHNGWKSLARSELAVPFQLTSFCLSILLVFRTTASFER